MLLSGERTVEFNDYFKLWRKLLTEKQKNDLLKEFEGKGQQAVIWLSDHLKSNTPLEPCR
ncbi:MAG: hypothetical protein CXR31_15605 [Geobacter sp.]|nr:MAG: hypothetical protein CXR31_15605 [Geobacter sp.]